MSCSDHYDCRACAEADAVLDEAASAAVLTAAQAALAWMHDPDADPLEEFERIAAEFRKATGFLRPGKDDRSGADDDERRRAWDDWCADRSRKVLADLRAALKAAGVGT